MKNLKIQWKINLLILFILLIFSFSVLTVTYNQLQSNLEKNIDEELTANSKLAKELLNLMYSGEWKIVDNKLYKGNSVINGDTRFVDLIKNTLGNEATIFQNDTRVTTSLMENGKRFIGTKAPDSVTAAVLKKGENYGGRVDIKGIGSHRVRYVPIKDADNNIIGMLFLGISEKQVAAQTHRIILFIIACAVIAIFIASLLGAFFSRMISKPLSLAVANLEAIADGDLTKDVPDEYLNRQDEIGHLVKSIKKMQDSMRGFIYNVNSRAMSIFKESGALAAVSEEMASSSQNIATAIEDVASGASNEANDLVNITSLLTDFGKMLDNTISSIVLIHDSSNSINDMTLNSNATMETLINSIKGSRASLDELLGIINGFEANLKQINEITEMINGIADETNLLALNAAIEAARAGESGKGFAVVANEIRKLAEESKASSTNISNILSQIVDSTRTVIYTAVKANDEVVRQSDIIDNTIDAFKQISEAVSGMMPEIETVNSNASQISDGKNQILEMIASISAVSEEVSASSEEISATTQEMSSATQEVAATTQSFEQMTKEMLDEVYKFKISENI